MAQVSPLCTTNYTVYSKLIPENIVKELYFILIPNAVSKQSFKKKVNVEALMKDSQYLLTAADLLFRNSVYL